MTSKMIVLNTLDGLIIAVLAILALSVAGLLVGWLPRLLHMSTMEFREFAFFVAFGAMLLMHAIAMSDSAP